MASESKGLVFATAVKKHAGRAKEKILQKVGKVDRTADEIFDDHVQNFNKQQNAANKLQKELNNYIRCVKAMQVASKTLYECMSEVYEPDWTGHDLLTVQSQNIEMLWQDLGHKMTDQVLIPLNTYQGQFPEMRKKIEKRGRKLVDYDGQRHSFQALQSSKKREEAKISRAKEQLEEAKRTFAVFNAELNEELPSLYDSRLPFFITNLQTLFSAEQVFHSELSKVHGELESIIDKLAKESSGRTSSSHYRRSSPPTQMLSSPGSNSLNSPENVGRGSRLGRSEQDEDSTINSPFHDHHHNDNDDSMNYKQTGGGLKDYEPVEVGAQVAEIATSPTNNGAAATTNGVNKSPPSSGGPGAPSRTTNQRPGVEELYDIPIGATTDNLPPGVLYRVRATYKYQAEDEDELSLEVGDTVQVIEYEDPEEQEEGWLMGIKEATGRQGLFPANFTRPI
ncbi:myc box-dependent-interacting protein 1 isoform X2 [Daphnia magna]|uniref:myc box-dependent-interacting protein 1 isoform X2 n=1 Tax=Daphnia magna TaxID=35525 RepID=UPI0006DEAC71|nr:myc box-dependent-interacting protein 1 isoform X2 [Daphnia magna]